MAKMVSVRDMQKAMNHMGMGTPAIDGTWGPETQASFGDWIHFHMNDVEYEMIPGASRREMQLSPDILVDTIREAARAYDNAAWRPSAAAAASPTSTASSATPAVRITQPFFRLNNVWLWLITGVGIGSLGYYGYKKRWFR